jgi:hypothetical protein
MINNMKKYFVIISAIFLVLVSCSDNNDGDSKEEGDSYESTLTVTINGDGFDNSTFTYTGIPNNTTYLWAVRYYTNDPFGGEGNYSLAQLYHNPPADGDQLEAANRGLVNICFTGNEPLTENISGDGITTLTTGEGRGVDLQIKLDNESFSRAYYISEGTTSGTITVTEYGSRIKGSFSVQGLQKQLEPGTTVDITGTFDLAYFGSF